MKKGYSIALMVDQRVSEGPRINLFNYGAHTTTLPAQLSSRFDCDIIPIYISRNENDKFEMDIRSIYISESERKNKDLITKKINTITEKADIKGP